MATPETNAVTRGGSKEAKSTARKRTAIGRRVASCPRQREDAQGVVADLRELQEHPRRQRLLEEYRGIHVSTFGSRVYARYLPSLLSGFVRCFAACRT